MDAAFGISLGTSSAAIAVSKVATGRKEERGMMSRFCGILVLLTIRSCL